MTKDLEIKVRRMWKARIKIVPVINGALGTIKKGLDQNLQLLPGDPSATELQKITLMSTAHIILKVLGSVTVISCCVLDLTEDHNLITNTREYSSSSNNNNNNNNNSKIYLNTNITSVT